MAFCFFGFFHRRTGVFLPRSGDNAETLGKTGFRFACLWDSRGKSRKPAEKCVSNLKLFGWDGGNENRRVFACSRVAMINNSSPSDGQEGCAEQFLERQTYPRGLESLAAAEWAECPLSGNPWGICKYAQEYAKTGRQNFCRPFAVRLQRKFSYFPPFALSLPDAFPGGPGGGGRRSP